MQKVTKEITFSITTTPEELERIKSLIESEVKKTLPPFVILRINDTKNNLKWFRVDDGTYKTLSQMNVSYCLGSPLESFFSPNNGQYVIERVMRPSDGLTVTIGDALFVEDDKFPSIVKSIHKSTDNDIIIRTQNSYTLLLSENNYFNSGTARLRTKVGNPKYDGESIYIVRHYAGEYRFLGRWDVERYSTLLYDVRNQFFDTKEEARAFIEENKPKPLFTTQDGVDIWDKDQIIYTLLPKAQWDKGSNTAHRVNRRNYDGRPLNSAWLRFSTKEARDEYMRLHKPIFSLQELLDAASQAPYVVSKSALKYMADQKLKA